MTMVRRLAPVILAALCAVLSGCATPKERTAPCKRLPGQTNFAAEDHAPDCASIRAVNLDRQAALAAIEAAAQALR
jgi:uncharacterized protein YceK